MLFINVDLCLYLGKGEKLFESGHLENPLLSSPIYLEYKKLMQLVKHLLLLLFDIWEVMQFFSFKREPRAKTPLDYFESQAFPGNQVFTERCFVQTFSGALYA